MARNASTVISIAKDLWRPASRRFRDLWQCRAAVAAVEFGMALPIFLTLTFGTIEFGRYLWSEHALSYAAEQAARFALANPAASVADVKAYAEAQLMTIDKAAAVVEVVEETLDGIPYLTVTVNYPFDALLPFLPLGSLEMAGVSRIPRTS